MDNHIILNIAHEVVIENLNPNNLNHAHVFILKLHYHVLMLVVHRQTNPPLS